MSVNPKQLLSDLKKELDGEFITEHFNIGNHTYTMRTLKDPEISWTFSYLDLGTEVGMALSVKLPQIAASIQAIDGVTKESLFEEDWLSLSEAEKMTILSGGNVKKNIFFCKKMLEVISDWNPEVLSELHAKWLSLDSRKTEVQTELKNS